MNDFGKFALIFALLTLITFSVFQIRYLNTAEAGETCPHTGEWTKIDSGDLSLYPVTGATEYCFKAGNWISSEYPDGGFDQPGSCNNGIAFCELSHWSYRLGSNQPTPTPTQEPEPSPTPTQEPEPSPTPTDGPEVTPTPTNVPEPTPTPTDEPEPTPTVTPYPLETQIGGIGEDSGNSDNNSNSSDTSGNSSTQAILATNTFSGFNSAPNVLAATGNFTNALMNSLLISGFATFILGYAYHIKKSQEE